MRGNEEQMRTFTRHFTHQKQTKSMEQNVNWLAMTESSQPLCRDQDSNLGCLGHNEKY